MKIIISRAYWVLLIGLLFSACKKNENPASPAAVKVSIEPSELHLKMEEAYLGTVLKISISNLPVGESDEFKWSVENPKIARVTNNGEVWPEGAGETYVLATLLSGKGVGKCKIIVTDGADYKYRLVLKDKGTSELSLSQPEKFLSAKAMERRRKANISIDAFDLPISTEYLKEIQAIEGTTIIAKSKWLNTVTVNCPDKFLIEKYKLLPFVKDVVLVGQAKRINPPGSTFINIPQAAGSHDNNNNLDYGTALSNISINNGQALHKKGFKGAGIDIAVIDAGFLDLQSNLAFKNVSIKGAKSFVYENDDPYAVDGHGIWVTSCMAVNLPGEYIGTAPEANYWLFRTEDQSSEYPVEEDYWVSAAEYADSAGVDIINSSLYYSSEAQYKYEDMDGKTAYASRGANMAFNKGILIVNCAGNQARWVGAPADSPFVLAVGSVNKLLNIDVFNSSGLTVDGRVKPDVLALGGGAAVINVNGVSENRDGTSYATPIISGLAACLWQAYPQLTNKELLDVLRLSGDRAATPVVPYGYGIVDMGKAMLLSEAIAKAK